MIAARERKVLWTGIVMLTLSFAYLPALAQSRETKVLIITDRVDHFINPYSARQANDPSHIYEDGARILKKCLEQTPGVTVTLWNRWPGNGDRDGERQKKQDIDTLVLYGDASPTVLLVDHEEEVMELFNRDVGLVAIHWSTGFSPLGRVARGNERWQAQIVPWLRLLGGMDGIGGNYICESTVELVGGGHPIQNGIKPFALRDEYYINLAILSYSQPLFQAKLDYQGQKLDNTVAWAYQRMKGKRITEGRSFGVTLGHFYAVWGVEEFRRLVVNGVLWTAHREIPPQGAPVEVTPRDLELPDYWRPLRDE